MKKYLFVSLIVLSPYVSLFAQQDTLFLKNNDVIVGEVKSLDKGVMTFKTDYSNVDFKIDWKKVNKLISNDHYLITLSDGMRYNGSLKSKSDSLIDIFPISTKRMFRFSKAKTNEENELLSQVTVPITQIVYLNSIDEGFWSRLSLFFDIGTNITKANDLRQLTFNFGSGYLADRWKVNLTFNNLRSAQSNTDPIQRNELALSYNYFLQKDWFLLYNLNMLANTEQRLLLRNSNMVGLGKYLVHTNKVFLGFQAGVNLNREKFEGDSEASSSGEGFMGVGYNIYDIGDLDLLTSVVVYPSLSNQDRIRTDFKFDIRYEFKFDLYFKVGTTLNYDNQSVVGASDLDYIIQTTVGWKL